MIRRVLGTIVGVLVAVVWFLAHRFRNDALVPRPPQHEFGTWVTNVSNTTITLETIGPHRLLHHPGTLGLYWKGGYGQVGGIVASGDSWAERTFSTSSQTPLPICSSPSLEHCEPVDIEGWAYETDPQDVGLEFEDIEFPSPLGSFGAWVVPAVDSTTWAIHVHGWSAARREAVRMLGAYHQQSVTSMVIDYRNDPGRPIDPSGHYRFGLSEWEDLQAAVLHAIEGGASSILLAGYSTGAAAVMAFMERSSLATKVVALVLDAPNINMTETVKAAARERSVPPPLMAGVKAVADLRWQVGWDEINYVQRAGDLKVPILVFHGDADDRVPIDVSRELLAANPEHVTLFESAGAGHVMSWNIDPNLYNSRLESFLEGLDRS